MDIKEILESLGFENLKDEGEFWRCRPIYRESDNETSLRVRKSSGFYQDFGLATSGSIGELTRIVLGLPSIKEAYTLLESKFKFNKPNLTAVKPKIKLQTKFSSDFVQTLTKDNSYWLKRGISKETIDQFEGGIDKKKHRYWFVIRNGQNEIIGLTGRTLVNSQVRWLHRGAKSYWNYPLSINLAEIQNKKEIILVESIGDLLSCFEARIRNCIVCFGLEVSNSLLSTLLKLQPKKIVIAFNNDGKDNSNAGNNGAEKTYSRLSRYFDERRLKIHLPSCNDLNELIQKEGKIGVQKWYGQLT